MRACVQDEHSRAPRACASVLWALFFISNVALEWNAEEEEEREERGGRGRKRRGEEKRLIAERSLSTLVYCIITPRIECGPRRAPKLAARLTPKTKTRKGVLGLLRRGRLCANCKTLCLCVAFFALIVKLNVTA